jgi:hypothetical protein
MTKEELIEELKKLVDDDTLDTEECHINADGLLLAFIGDEEVALVFHAIKKWYA